jgi:WD40 repeat protein
LPGHTSGISKLLFNDSGSLLATASYDGSVQLWDYNDLNTLPLIFNDHEAQVWNMAFSKDSNYLMSGCENGNIKVWPTRVDILSNQICDHLNRNMRNTEWNRYVASDIQFEETCNQDNLP